MSEGNVAQPGPAQNQATAGRHHHFPLSSAPPPPDLWRRPPAVGSRSTTGQCLALIGAAVALVTLWMPWTVITATTTGESVSADGLQAGPPQCFITCAAPNPSPTGILLAVLAGLGLLAGLLQFAARDRAVRMMVVVLGWSLPSVAVFNILFTLAATSATFDDPSLEIYPGIGAFLAVAAGVTATVGSHMARGAQHRPADASAGRHY